MFAHQVALAELGKLDEGAVDDDEAGVWCDVDLLLMVYPPYKRHGLLPEAGGVLDQNPLIMRSLNKLDLMVEYYKQNPDRKGTDDLPGLDD